MAPLIPIIVRLLIAGASIGATALGLKTMNRVGEDRLFNNGVCSKCGGHFQLKTEVKGSRAYKCDFCSNSVLISNSSEIDKGYIYRPSIISKK